MWLASVRHRFNDSLQGMGPQAIYQLGDCVIMTTHSLKDLPFILDNNLGTVDRPAWHQQPLDSLLLKDLPLD